MRLDTIIIEPVLTEKSNSMREGRKYAFKVDSRANKIEICQAVAQLFDVHALKCNIIKVKPKPKKVRYKKGHTSSWKKAIVTLKDGETISAFEGA